MSDHRPNDNRQILEEASQWFVDFRLRKMDKSRRDEFMRWLKRSPEHIRAYMEIGRTYARLPHSTEVRPADIERLLATVKGGANVLTLDVATDGQRQHAQHVMRSRVPAAPARRLAKLRLAASFAFASIGVALVTWFALTRSDVYVTQIAERRLITLEDGSKIELNADSKVRIAFSETRRAVDLLEGQALFHVAKEPRRPFIVTSAGVQIRAVGTQFDVHRKRSGSVVSVLEGRVEVLDLKQAGLDATGGRHGARAQPVLLVAGEQAVITATAIEKPEQPNVAVATAWVQGQFEFDETPLADVVEEFNRHSRRTLVIESPAIAAFRISGVYSSDDPSSLIRFLRSQPELTVIETDREVRIRSK